VDAEGRLLERSFLRYPLEFTRITSSFSESRFHPILKTSRPHLGVDFAAPAGTPVLAVASGYVRSAGWKKDFGRHVEIDHGDGLISAYSHLRGIDPSLKTGRLVRQGEVVGWVGQSGLATGPHLHFAMFDNGEYINPLTTKKTARRVQLQRHEFENVRATLIDQLRAIPGTYATAPSTPPVLLSTVAQARQFGPVVLTL
jgi:murein DD-endopeptidase MepM/ murein hydrolase activator NlpD